VLPELLALFGAALAEVVSGRHPVLPAAITDPGARQWEHAATDLEGELSLLTDGAGALAGRVERTSADTWTKVGRVVGGTELTALLQAQSQSILSKRTVQEEFKRRGVLSDDFDPEEEDAQIAQEQQGIQPETLIDPVTGKIIPTNPLTGQPMPAPPQMLAARNGAAATVQ